MKNLKSIIRFTKNKYKVLTNRDLKLSLNKSAIKSSKFYKNTDTLINYNSENKELKLSYRKIQLDNHDNCYLIKLFTGKKHQIRLQFFLNDNPIIGDKKFNNHQNKNLLLSALSIHFFYLNKFYKFHLKI